MSSRRFYWTVRDLHLYCGLFLSPFVLVFTVSVFFLVHAWLPRPAARIHTRTVAGLNLPDNIARLDGRARVDAVRSVFGQLDVAGEIGFIQHFPRKHRLLIPVLVPGRETTIDLDYQSKTAAISSRDTGLADALVYLHKAPGPHLAAIRGNWFMVRVWRWLADITVYLVLFVSISGIYLWTILRAERRAGIVLLSAGALCFFAVIYALSH
jgi:hypothetical protein